MKEKIVGRIFWPLFIGAIVALLAGKTAYPSLAGSLAKGAAAAIYVLALIYAVTEHRLLAQILRAGLVTCTILYLIYLATGLAWSLLPWGAALLVVASALFLRKSFGHS
jgi:hypothetical protein